MRPYRFAASACGIDVPLLLAVLPSQTWFAVAKLFVSHGLRIASLAALSLMLLPSSHAQSAGDLSGRYQCAQAKIQGKVVPCNTPPLTLKNDGKFELRGWEGSYMVTGEWVELSDTVVRSRAKIEPGHRIVFRYHGKHGWCEMVFERRIAELGKTSLG